MAVVIIRRNARKAVALDKRQLNKEIDRDLRAKAKERLQVLRNQLKAAKARRSRVMHEVRTQCRAARVAARDRAGERLAALRATIKGEREAARHRCARAYEDARALDEIDRASAELSAERQYQRELRRIDAGNRVQRSAVVRSSRSERRAESDDEVRQNIAENLIPLWQRVKRGIKGSARESRTEAFMRYVEANPHEAIEAIEAGIDKHIAELERKERQARHAISLRRYDEVPF